MMSWIYLVLAGLLEVSWAVGLKYTEGFTRPIPTVLTLLAMLLSVGMLGLALRNLPLTPA
jgi:quaternary ammonium compound-resistance protein SugE